MISICYVAVYDLFSDANTHFGQRINEINLTSDKKWSYTTEQGDQGLTDTMILTMPVTQILQLKGDIAKIIGKFRDLA